MVIGASFNGIRHLMKVKYKTKEESVTIGLGKNKCKEMYN